MRDRAYRALGIAAKCALFFVLAVLAHVLLGSGSL